MLTPDENPHPQPGIEQPQAPRPDVQPPSQPMNRALIGAILVLIGLIALAANVWRSDIIGMLVLPALGIIFLVGAFMGRIPGLLIPGSILLGLGLGTLAQQTLFASATGEARGAVVVIGLALGFLAIMPLFQLLQGSYHWWPAIPGGILLIVGAALLAGPAGMAFLQLLGMLWPVALIAGGAYLLWLVYRQPQRHRQGTPT